jgi:hypothetical protein
MAINPTTRPFGETDGFGDAARSTASEVANTAKEAVSQIGQNAADGIDRQRVSAAESLDSAARKLHENAQTLPGGQKVATLAHSTADKLEATAHYVRDHDMAAMMGDVEGLVKRYPGQSLLAAVAFGFLMGRALRNG